MTKYYVLKRLSVFVLKEMSLRDNSENMCNTNYKFALEILTAPPDEACCLKTASCNSYGPS